MAADSLILKFGRNAPVATKKNEPMGQPRLKEAARLAHGAFQFKAQLPKETIYIVQSSPDLRNWNPVLRSVSSGAPIDFVDSTAAKVNYRFYRLLAGNVFSANVIGFISFVLPPGFSMIANPFDGPGNSVGELFKDWPDGTTLNRFDPMQFKLAENGVESGHWTNPSEKLIPGEGAIFFNPTSDYKPLNLVGEVRQGRLSLLIPSGFSICSSLLPLPGHLQDDLAFPIAHGDVIHVFDRERQQYVLHPYEGGKWTAGAPTLSAGESFWVAKAEAGDWVRDFHVAA